MRDLFQCFLISTQKHTRGEKRYEFLSYELVMWKYA